MRTTLAAGLLICLAVPMTAATALAAQPASAAPTANIANAIPDDERAVLRADADFWIAYNRCDMDAAGDLMTEDVEFYHDRTGLTTTREGLVASLRKGPCDKSNGFQLRREAIDDTLAFHRLEGGYALLSGRHRFYVTPTGEPEHLDGQAGFTTVWKLDDGHWRMHRVVSFAHGPAQ